MARRPFDPAAHDLSDKVVYQQGDVLDRESVDALVEGADVVMHLAFILIGDPDEAQRINVEGSRNVFEATVAAKAQAARLHVVGRRLRLPRRQPAAARPRTSRPAAPTTSTTRPTRPSSRACSTRSLAGSKVDAYVFRPCIVAGAGAITLIETMVGMLPVYGQLRLARRVLDQVPFLGPVLPDPGHRLPARPHRRRRHRARSPPSRATGEPGRYNLAGPGAMSVSAHGPRARLVVGSDPRRRRSARSTTCSRKLPGLPAEAAWLTAFRCPVLMDTRKARERARLGAAVGCRGDPARDDRRRPRVGDPLSATGGRYWSARRPTDPRSPSSRRRSERANRRPARPDASGGRLRAGPRRLLCDRRRAVGGAGPAGHGHPAGQPGARRLGHRRRRVDRCRANAVPHPCLRCAARSSAPTCSA